jgi:hypothetical protein
MAVTTDAELRELIAANHAAVTSKGIMQFNDGKKQGKSYRSKPPFTVLPEFKLKKALTKPKLYQNLF